MGILFKVLGSKFGPWVLLGLVIALGFSHVWMYGSGKTNGVNQERAVHATAIAKTVERVRREHEEDLKQRGWQDEREAKESNELRQALGQRLAELSNMEPKVLIKTRVVRDESGCDCNVSSLGPHFWLQFRAAGGQRGEADPAAPDSVSR